MACENDYTERLKSFDTWPNFLPVNVRDLVDAGLVYTGVGDSVRCYFCGGGLRNWERGDVPMEEHTKWFPKCQHILLVKGQDYVETLGRNDEQENGSPSAHSVVDSGINHIESVAAQSCLEMGYPREKVEAAIRIFIHKNDGSNFKGKDLCEILFEIEDNEEDLIRNEKCDIAEDPELVGSSHNVLIAESSKRLIKENQTLKQNQICKLCTAEDYISFIAYNHLVGCSQCYPVLSGPS